MVGKKRSKNRLGRAVFGFFFVMIAVFGLTGGVLMNGEDAYADPETSTTSGENATSEENTSSSAGLTGDGCQSSLGAIGWLVCPTTGAIAQGVDFLYGLIKDFLVIDPVAMEDGAPIYEIWKYFRGLTNIVFIIFLLVVIYSQITGWGISNYGVKKSLPKLIVAAVLVNLSFLLCSLAVDVSNIVGEGLRGAFDAIAKTAVVSDGGTTAAEMDLKNAEMFSALAGGTALTIGGTAIAFASGSIWMLIPVLLGAIVSVVTGLITIALRQAVVALLIMISPLAVVAYMLPNTDGLFKKWKKLLTQMLVFYPMFSLLFGASSLAGFAIIMGSKDGLGVLLGIAVQIFPLFFSWKLMQMSGTFLGDINSKLRAMTARPVAGSRAWADSRRMATKQKNLAMARPTTSSLRLMQFMSNRRIAREAETADNADLVKKRGLAYQVGRNYKLDPKTGKVVMSKAGEEEYENQARKMKYQEAMDTHSVNFNEGLAKYFSGDTAQQARLEGLDKMNMDASDKLKAVKLRGEIVDYRNAVSFHKRMENAVNAHFDEIHGDTRDANGNLTYHKHDLGGEARADALARYNTVNQVMHGRAGDVQFAAAGAATDYTTQKKIVTGKFQNYFELVPPTKDVELRLEELTKMSDAADHIDEIIPGLKALNQRGDTDLVRKQIENILNSEKGVELGSHASQALASFLMFDVKDNDPYLRRYGKYINLETAQVYNKNNRQNARLSLEEFVTGEYEDWEPGHPEIRRVGKSKRTIVPLMEGTSLDKLERTAYGNLDDILKNAYTNGDGHLDVKKYLEKREEIEVATTPAFVSASTKYLAGSEQLKNAVKFLTGIDDSGKTRWAEGGDLAGEAAIAEKYFRKRSMQYIKDQTPAQILGMRSDYRDAMMEHLVNEYLEENPEEQEKYIEEMAKIQASYGDEDIAVAEKKRKEDASKLKMDLAGQQMRRILGDTGKLEQIYKTRRSGAANNAKDWLRKWVNLDDENALRKEVDFYKEKQRQAWEEEMRRRKEADPDFEYEAPRRLYNEADQDRFKAEMYNVRDEYIDGDTDTFFEKTKQKLEEFFGKDNLLAWEYNKYYQDTKNADNDELYSWLDGALSDLDGYPGNEEAV